VGPSPALTHTHTPDQALLKLLSERQCAGCNLQDADLVHADLRGANLRNAQLQRANLSQARLEGANLQGANLSFTSLQGAYLQGANLLGATLEGTDLRQADLSGAALSPGALSRTHWGQAKGINPEILSHSEIHNAGVTFFEHGSYVEAELYFGEAIKKNPNSAESWAARGLSRAQQENHAQAAADINYAANLLDKQGSNVKAQATRELAKRTASIADERGIQHKGTGFTFLQGAMQLFQVAAPFALRALSGGAF